MLYKLKENKLESIAFEDFGSIGRKEKELESIFAQNLEMIYGEYGILFPISQERQGQGQPDLCALDKEGNLIIFEFKRSDVPEGTTNQIMRYTEIYGQKSYDDLNFIYKNYISKKDGQVNMELVDAHREAFALEEPLKLEYFNHKQKMIIIGSLNWLKRLITGNPRGLVLISSHIAYLRYRANITWNILRNHMIMCLMLEMSEESYLTRT